MICPKCGSEMNDGSTFCTKCGAALGENVQNQNMNTQNGAAEGNAGPQGNPQMGNPQGNPQMGNTQGNPQMGSQQAGPQGTYNNSQMYNNGMPYGMPQQPYVDPKDHTAEFDPKDISENKVMALTAYLLGTIGIIIALLAAKESPYAGFHVRQALKLTIVNMLLTIITLVLCWTVIVPFAGAVCAVIIFVVRIICFFQVCSGKAKEAAIVSSFGFLN